MNQLLERPARRTTAKARPPVLGIDFGSTNATAWTVLAFEKHSPMVYVVETYKAYGMAPSATADVTKQWIAQYHPDVIIGDSAAKGYIDEQLPMSEDPHPVCVLGNAEGILVANEVLMGAAGVGRLGVDIRGYERAA